MKVVILFLIITNSIFARQWVSSDGKVITGELLNFDSVTNQMTLERSDGKIFTFNTNRLCSDDIAYIHDLERTRLEEQNKIEKAELDKAGTTIQYLTQGEHALNYYAYFPKSYSAKSELPLLILFSPSGHVGEILANFQQAADKFSWILVGCDGFENGMDEALGKERFEEMLPDIEKTIKHDKNRLYMGGFSGGAWRAYHYTVYFDRPWNGIVACGGWLGGKEYYHLKYPRKMVIAIINGDHDKNANSWFVRDKEILEKRRCKVKHFNFAGGHEPAPSDVLMKAIEWMEESNDKKN